MNKHGITVYDGNEYRKLIAFDRPFFPPSSSLFIMKKGTIEFERQLQFIRITEPIVAFIDHKVVYEFSHISEDVEAYIISISKEFYDAISLKFNTLHVYHYFKSQRGKHFPVDEIQLNEFFSFASLLQNILKNAQRHKNLHELLDTIFAGLVQLLASFMDEVPTFSKKISRQELIALTFLQNVELHFKDQKYVQFYAEKQFITVRYLSETLKKTIGKTGLEIINEFQLKEAMALLADTDHSIADITENIGFSDIQTFHHFFKRHTGISPSQYRLHFSQK